MMRNAIIFVNSDSVLDVNTAILGLDSSTIYCADGGANYAREMDIQPDIIIGDLDSVTNETLEFYKTKEVEIIHDGDQNSTDLELALQHAVNQGFERIRILGSLAGRSDQALGNFFILAHSDYSSVIIEAVSKNEITSFLATGTTRSFYKKEGLGFSIIPTVNSVVTLKNFKWDLDKSPIEVGSGLGISNLLEEDEAFVEIHEGAVFTVQSNLQT